MKTLYADLQLFIEGAGALSVPAQAKMALKCPMEWVCSELRRLREAPSLRTSLTVG